MILVEACAGTAALTFDLLFGARPPASRIGSKAGYAHVIREQLGVSGSDLDRVILVDSDPALVNALRWAFAAPETLAETILNWWVDRVGSRTLWEGCGIRRGLDSSWSAAAAWWIWTAGARGGIGGWKGAHILRPSVDGFIPSLPALAARFDALWSVDCVEVVCADVATWEPPAGAVVYLDPPYDGTQGYRGQSLSRGAVLQCVERWRSTASRIVVSEREGLAVPGARQVDVTNHRRGQGRRSLTTSAAEWLTVLDLEHPRSSLAVTTLDQTALDLWRRLPCLPVGGDDL